MLQRLPWTRPALQQSEAVLLPALFGKRKAEPLYSDRYTRSKPEKDPFVPLAPLTAAEGKEVTALSTYVRPRGSMAGRSVLRAAGVYPALFQGQRRRQEYIFFSNRRSSGWQSRRYR